MYLLIHYWAGLNVARSVHQEKILVVCCSNRKKNTVVTNPSTAPRPTLLAIKWNFRGQSGRTVKLTIYLILVNKSKYLTFICRCIASISLKYNQQDATFLRSAYFYKLLYVFHAVPPSIIRSTKLYIQRQVLSNQYCCLLLSWMRWREIEKTLHLVRCPLEKSRINWIFSSCFLIALRHDDWQEDQFVYQLIKIYMLHSHDKMVCDCGELKKTAEEMVAKYCNAWKHRGFK
jgi:hypothetical protein